MLVSTSAFAITSLKEDSTCIYGVSTTPISVEVIDSSFINQLDIFLNKKDSIIFNDTSYMHYIFVENDSIIQIGIIVKQGMTYYVKSAQCNKYCLDYKNIIFHMNDTINHIVSPVSPISSCGESYSYESNIHVSNNITHVFYKYKYSDFEYRLIEHKELSVLNNTDN